MVLGGVDGDISVLGAEQLLSAHECLACGDIGVLGLKNKDVALPNVAVAICLQNIENSALSEYAVYLTACTGNDKVAPLFSREFDEFLECTYGSGVQIAGIAHAQHDDSQTGIFGNACYLLAEEVSRTEEEVAFHVHNGNLGQALGFVVEFLECALVVLCKLISGKEDIFYGTNQEVLKEFFK